MEKPLYHIFKLTGSWKADIKVLRHIWASLVAQTIKNQPANVEDLGSLPGLGRFPGGDHVNSILYSCLENPHSLRSLMCYSPWGRRV